MRLFGFQLGWPLDARIACLMAHHSNVLSDKPTLILALCAFRKKWL
jgi:hypothetical protein